MRPVNLIPPEQRRGNRAPLRTGSLPYAFVALLAAALIAVTAIVVTGNQVAERESELAGLEAREAAARASAEALQPYADFAALSQARQATVTSLAQSRFDWERVLRELALVLPSDVWLVSVTGAAPGAEGETATGITGPSLEISGCGRSHEAVGAFVTALEDIDGVTRVGLASSELPEGDAGGAGEGSDCQTRDFIAKFEITVAFDGVAAAAATAPAPAPPLSPPADAEPAVADAEASQQQARDSGARQTERARRATNLVPGV